jgi:hypothetical protein
MLKKSENRHLSAVLRQMREAGHDLTKRYFSAAEIMQMFDIAPDDYETYNKYCRDLNLPRLPIGKRKMHPVIKTLIRLEEIEETQLEKFRASPSINITPGGRA